MTKRKRPSPAELEAAQRATRERMANVDPDEMLRLHKDMHPDPDQLLRQKHLDQGDTIQHEDDSVVLYTPSPTSPPERFKNLTGVLNINYEAGETIFETRVYHTIPFADLTAPPHELKILAKTRPDGRIHYIAKMIRPDGSMYLSAESDGWVTEDAFRDSVQKTVDTIASISMVSPPTIQTGADYERIHNAAHPTPDPRIGKEATYTGRELAMKITGVIYAIDDKYIWIRDADGRERGCRPDAVKLLS